MSVTGQHIIAAGFFETSLDSFAFETLANRLGTPLPSRKNGPVVDLLIPKSQEEAHPNSLSAINGLGNFPFHSDGAYFPVPPRFIALRYNGTEVSQTPTLLMPVLDTLSAADHEVLAEEMWQVRGRSFNFYSSIISRSPAEYIRFDTTCMKPFQVESAAANIINSERYQAGIISVSWHPDKVVIFDNWRWLHARPVLLQKEAESRSLQRIMINVGI